MSGYPRVIRGPWRNNDYYRNHQRLLIPGKQPIGMLLTILVGIVAAFLGTALARAMGIPTATSGVDWLELLVQVVIAALGVALVSTLTGRRRGGIRGGILRR